MIGMLKRHEVQVLRKAGRKVQEVAELTGVSARSIKRIAAEPAVIDPAVAMPPPRRGRPPKAEPFRSFVVEQLKSDPELLAVEVLRRARLHGYGGGKTALYRLIASVRQVSARPIVRFEGLAGEFTQHDFGQVDVRFIDGHCERVHFFGSRLKYSRWVEVTLVEDERAETLVRAMVGHFESMGGIPLLAVFDRPKTVAVKWRHDGVVTEWNPTFAGVALDLGLGVEVCWPHSPEQKGSVENLVGWVKGSFFKQRRFVDHEDLVKQLGEWLIEVNTVRPCRATGVIPAERLSEERPRLRPLKVQPSELALRYPVVVGPTGYVVHDAHLYSMDPEAIGIAGTLYLYRDRVRIVASRHEAWHPRLWESGAKSTLPAHRARRVASVSGKRGRRYMQREHLLDLGGAALEYLTEVVHRRPQAWVRDVERLHELLQRHGEQALREAFQRALDEQAFGAEYVAHFLQTPPTIVQPKPSQLELLQ